jgi:hypothetical protein
MSTSSFEQILSTGTVDQIMTEMVDLGAPSMSELENRDWAVMGVAAINTMEAMLKAMVYKRDHHGVVLQVEDIKASYSLESLVGLLSQDIDNTIKHEIQTLLRDHYILDPHTSNIEEEHKTQFQYSRAYYGLFFTNIRDINSDYLSSVY